jgi:hypothetical protein
MQCRSLSQQQRGESLLSLLIPSYITFLKSRKNPQHILRLSKFPEGHPALVNVFITNYFLYSNIQREWPKVAAAYNKTALEYNNLGWLNSQDEANFQHMVDEYSFQGTVFYLGCRPYPLLNRCRMAQSIGSLIKFDLSPGIVDICRRTGPYN